MDVYYHKMNEAKYPDYPYDPSEYYPEFSRYKEQMATCASNEVYSAVRDVLEHLDLDQENQGTEYWNPLKELIHPGQQVLLKPNLVYHQHPKGNKEVLSMVTNAAVLRPLIDYILLATHGNCKIIIGDAPVQGADFACVTKISGVDRLVEYYREKGIEIKLIDMRQLISVRNDAGILGEKHRNPNRTKQDYFAVDLKDKTELYEIIDACNRFEITDYAYRSVMKHHNRKKNEYIIPKEVLRSDLIINIPKLKTHRKAGITCAMKNLVGINGDKTCLAHHTRGVKGEYGDEFNERKFKTICKVRIWTFLKTTKAGIFIAGLIMRFFQKFVWCGQTIKEYNMEHRPKVFTEGSWYGNDTLWRCVKDINKIALYADKNGNMKGDRQRNYLCMVDAVLAGEKEGPMEQTTVDMGVVFGGKNPVYVDYLATKLMRLDYHRIPLIKNGFYNKWWILAEKQPEEIHFEGNVTLDRAAHYFTPSFGWRDALDDTRRK